MDYGQRTIDGKFFIKGVPNENDGSSEKSLKFWTGTQVEYDAIPVKDDNTLYYVI